MDAQTDQAGQPRAPDGDSERILMNENPLSGYFQWGTKLQNIYLPFFRAVIKHLLTRSASYSFFRKKSILVTGIVPFPSLCSFGRGYN